MIQAAFLFGVFLKIISLKTERICAVNVKHYAISTKMQSDFWKTEWIFPSTVVFIQVRFYYNFYRFEVTRSRSF